MYIWTNVLGSFVFDDKLKIIDSVLFKNVDDLKKKEQIEKQLNKKYNKGQLNNEQIKRILAHFKHNSNFAKFREYNLHLTKLAIKNSVKNDHLIIQTINAITEIDKAANMLAKRLREWYELYLPEFSKSLQDHEKFVELVLKKSKKELIQENKIKETMGADIDISSALFLAKEVQSLFELRKKEEEYLEKIMKETCPNTQAIAGSTIGAKLLEKAGSLKRLAEFPASTVQLLGAEKALFRHMKTGARPPRFGFLHEHPLISKMKEKEKGKVARALADKISLAAKVDLFGGEKDFGIKVRKQLEEKFK
ncbi:MAG: NOP5/NOP56 family protein [Candidatus Woesearchaeota archaeon]